MGIFGDYLWRSGLTFETKQGHVQYLKTALRNNILQFISDIRTLEYNYKTKIKNAPQGWMDKFLENWEQLG
jgi:hypothetical protein